jgi:predicted transport protein
LLSKVKDRQTLERIKEIMAFCDEFPNVQRYVTGYHIVYRTARIFARVYPQRHQFWVDIPKKGINDPKGLMKHQHPVHGHVEVPNDLDLAQVKDLIKQAYEATTRQLAIGAS